MLAERSLPRGRRRLTTTSWKIWRSRVAAFVICSLMRSDPELQREVLFNNASEEIFEVGSAHSPDDLLTAADRRPAALVRLRKYAGTGVGYKPFTELLKQRNRADGQPGVIFPSPTRYRPNSGATQTTSMASPLCSRSTNLERLERLSRETQSRELSDYDACGRTCTAQARAPISACRPKNMCPSSKNTASTSSRAHRRAARRTPLLASTSRDGALAAQIVKA